MNETGAAGSSSDESAGFRLVPAFTKSRFSASLGPHFGTNGLNLGLGLRAGYTLPMQLYLGVVGEYWFGEKEEAFGTEVRAFGWDVMGEFGYDIGITDSFVLRPLGAMGAFESRFKVCTPGFDGEEDCVKDSEMRAVGAVRLQALVDLAPVNLGGEFGVLIAEEAAALFGFQVGVAF